MLTKSDEIIGPDDVVLKKNAKEILHRQSNVAYERIK
jgi:hypothetical protein